MCLSEEMLSYIDSTKQEAYELLKKLCVIPAPSGHEELRAEFVKNRMTEDGFPNISVDEALNVTSEYMVSDKNKIFLFTAHTDIVFPDMTTLPLREDEENIYCPGIGDDTENLVSMLLAARYIISKKMKPEKGLGFVFAANSCEEGLGNLKGMRKLIERYGDRIYAHITFDGSVLNHIVTNAVGSRRFCVSVQTKGGHSFAAFGNSNAIACLAEIINKIYQIQVPVKPNTKTTYNVGTISGGTSVNTIAQEASMLCEYRSDDSECLALMGKEFNKIFESFISRGIDLSVKCVGDRPCKAKESKESELSILSRIEKLIPEMTGKNAVRISSSTDCNIPMSLGIPSFCLAGSRAVGAHTREEYVIKKEQADAYRFTLRVIAEFVEG